MIPEAVKLEMTVRLLDTAPAGQRIRREFERCEAEALPWRRTPAVVLWGGRDVDYQLGAADDRRRALMLEVFARLQQEAR